MAKFEIGQKVRVIGKFNLEDGLDVSKEYAIERLREGQYSYLIGKSWWMREDEIEAVITDFQSGDIVRAEKGDEIIQGKVFIDVGDQTLYIDISFGAYIFTLEELEQEGYTLTLVKRPEPEIVLPTKPGMYYATEDKYERGDEWHSDGKIFYYLNTDGIWIDLGWGQPSVIDGELKVYKNE